MTEAARDQDARLDALEARLSSPPLAPLAAFDPPGLAMIQSLLRTAGARGGLVGDRLVDRAEQRLAMLEARFAHARRHAEEEVVRLCSLGAAPEEALHAAIDRGELLSVERAARKHREKTPRQRVLAKRAVIARLDEEARSRGVIVLGGAARAGTIDGRTALELANRLYRRSAATATASIVLTRAEAELPENPGRYHGTTVATRTLRTMESLSVDYLHAFLERLEDLSAMQDFVAPEVELELQKKGRGKKKRPS